MYKGQDVKWGFRLWGFLLGVVGIRLWDFIKKERGGESPLGFLKANELLPLL